MSKAAAPTLATKPYLGQKVDHARWGRGEIVKIVRGGRQVLVRFGGNEAPWQLKLTELTLHEPEPMPPEPPARRLPTDPCPELQTLEAFRLGVVPHGGTELTTVGRDVELEVIASDLAEAEIAGCVRVILGDYGTGKTHLMEIVERMALERNFLVSKIVLDQDQVSPAHPKRVYRELVRRLIYPDNSDAFGLAPLFDKAIKTDLGAFLKRSDPAYHHYLSPTLAYYRELQAGANRGVTIGESPETTARRSGDAEAMAHLLDWIEGNSEVSNLELEQNLRQTVGLRGHRFYALKDYRPWAHIYTYLVGGLAHLAKSVGYNGIVLLFDEAEFYSLLNQSGQSFADLLFGYYCALALGPGGVKFDLDRAKRGGHAVHQSFPPIYGEQHPVYCVFAMTDDPWGAHALSSIVGQERLHELRALTLSDYQELCRRIVEIYRLAHPDFNVGAEVQNPMGQVVYRGVERGTLGNPRQVLKFVVEMLDFSRLKRDQIGDFVKEVLQVL